MPRKAKESRENFEAGKVDSWGAGEWGSVVRVFKDKGKLKIRYRPPGQSRAKQRTLFVADTPELRARATAIAVKKSEALRLGEAEKAAAAEDLGDGPLTVFDVVLLYMKRVPGFTAELLDKPASEIRTWYDSLPESARTHAAWTIIGDVYGFRRLFKDDRFHRDRPVDEIEPGDATTYVADYIAGGGSPRTAVNDTDRISCAFRYVKSQHRRTIGLVDNPVEGRRVDRDRADIDEYTTQEGRALRAAAPQLAEEGQWQILVAAGMATSGRRVGSFRHLTLDDHDLEANTVTWRAAVAKGENYGRGNEVRPMTAQHRAAVLWAVENHPNPKGSAYPILWRTGGRTGRFADSMDPTQPVPYSTLHAQLMRLEDLAEVEHKHHRAFHAFRRWAVTVLADEHGDGVAAEFVGMTVETVRAHTYKKVQNPTMQRASATLDGLAEEHEEAEDTDS